MAETAVDTTATAEVTAKVRFIQFCFSALKDLVTFLSSRVLCLNNRFSWREDSSPGSRGTGSARYR